MKKKYHIVYRTDNLVNGKYYHGVHSTDNLEDGYLGSGTAIEAAIAKYGKEAFKRTILGFYDSREDMIIAEKEAVNHEDPMSYNILAGGGGTVEPRTGLPVTDETRKKISDAHKGKTLRPETRKKISDALKGRKFSKERIEIHIAGQQNRAPHSLETRKKISDSKIGKPRSPETRKKMIDINKGRIAYYNPDLDKGILLHKGSSIPEGYIKGAKPMSQKTKDKIGAISSGGRYYKNLKLGKSVRISEGTPIPLGFIPGRLPYSRAS